MQVKLGSQGVYLANQPANLFVFSLATAWGYWHIIQEHQICKHDLKKAHLRYHQKSFAQ